MRIVVLKFKVIYDTKNYNSPLEFIDCLSGENKSSISRKVALFLNEVLRHVCI